MGIDICHKNERKVRRNSTRSPDVYHRLLVKLYKFLARRTGKKFNKIILKRLYMSRMNRPPISTSQLTRVYDRAMSSADCKKQKTIVIVGKVTNDERQLTVPGMKICALGVSERARERIQKSGGEILTFDQLALKSPTGANTLLVRGKRTAREACRHFGRAPGAKNSDTKPFVRSKGRKFERARGRRKTCGYKN
ncbi:hypothetical protein SNEBB_011237 [Seison nebaliae]|nr:hypothetical protein SNEBB_011237 [Seison nebaliae]